jgi:hypothetical protein
MRLGSFLFSATLAAGFGLLALSFTTFAQEPGSGLTAVAELPAAPRPQHALAEAEPLAQQDPAGQNQSTQQAAPNPTPAPSPAAQGSSSSQTPAQQPGAEKSQHEKAGQQIAAPGLQTGNISGTAIDVNGDLVPGATVVLDGPVLEDRRTILANDNGLFEFDGLKPGTSYRVTISAKGFVTWTSPAVILKPGQYLFLTDINLQVAGGVTSVNVFSSTEQIAIEQVRIEEQQRVFGIIPNFYVVYDSHPAPLTVKLKFELARKAYTDPVTFLAVFFMAGIYQAAGVPNYAGCAKGYGERIASIYADGVADIYFGGAILPSLLHQDPRYYYQGTGTKKSRALHAFLSPFICRGDNGRLQPNYSSVGGDLISGAISNAYYPQANRGTGLMFENDAIVTASRIIDSLTQEFILRKFTHKAKKQK